MTKLTEHDIRKIANLAKLSVNKEKIAEYKDELSKILDFVDQISKVNTDAILPLTHALDLKQSLRPDEVTFANQREELQKLAPKIEAGLYLVPNVINACEVEKG